MSHKAGNENRDQFGGNDDSQTDQGNGKSVRFDQFDTTTYLHSSNPSDGSFDEHFILQVNGFELHGAPVELPGFGTHYGMYFLIDATGHGGGASPIVFNSMNIALMVDRGNNDGTPSATEQGVGFSNGTSGDVALATGVLNSANIVVGSDGTFHPHFIQDITLTEAGERIFGKSLDTHALLQELLTTPGGPTSFDEGGGNTVNVVDGVGKSGLPATGSVTFDPQTTLSIRPGLFGHEPGCN
jgi:hypothetical protein